MKAPATITLATLVSFALSAAPQAQERRSHKGPDPYMGRAFVFEADLEAARRLGWIDADASEDLVLDHVAETLEARLRGSGKFVEARVEREEGRRFSATFVGVQPRSYEAFLEAGLGIPARLSLAAVLSSGEPGLDLEAEHARLVAWRAAHPDADLGAFHALGADEGGPDPEVRWVPRRTTGEHDGASLLAVRRTPLHRFVREDFEEHAKAVGTPPFSLRVPFAERTAERLSELTQPYVGHEVAWLVDGEAVFTRRLEEPISAEALLESEFTPAEARVLIFALRAPHDVPLRFVGFEKRPLHGVADRGN